MAKVISAAEAAALIGDGMTVAVDGFIGFSLAEDILCEMEERFLREGHPRDLRLVNVAGLGGDGKEFIAFDMNEHFSTPPHNQRRWAGRCLPWNCPHAESSRRSHCRGK